MIRRSRGQRSQATRARVAGAVARVAALALIAVITASPALAQGNRPPFHARFLALGAQRGLTDSARLRQLFALDWEYTNVESPETATFVGYPGQQDRWTDYSPAALARRNRELSDRLVVLRAIDRRKLGPADQLSYDIFARGVNESIEGARFPSDLLAVTQLQGPQYLADVVSAMPASSVADYEHILTRLAAIPRVIDQTIVLLDSGLARGVTPPRVTLRSVPRQIQQLVPDAPARSALFAPFNSYPDSISPANRARLSAQASRVYAERLRPAYLRLGRYLARTYIPHARETIARSALPDGRDWYAFDVKTQTTTSRTPAEIHRLGLDEVRRIRAEMDSVIRSTGFPGDFAAFVAMLHTDRRFYVTDSASLVNRYREITKGIDPQLPRLFGRLPRLGYVVSTVPSYSAPSQASAYYVSGSPETQRPGQFFVNTYNLAGRPTWEMEALTAHEAVPGHHLQIALSQELGDLPEFRRYGGYVAFTEGWGLYAEGLGAELGLYRDPYAKFGQLSNEIWRAIRLVLDTGIHDLGWTREQAIAYFRANSTKSDDEIRSEVDRYIVRPGQALAYKSGELEFKALRARAQRTLGDRFDVRAFHDEVLSQGALPLDILDARMTRWISAQRVEGR